MAKKFKVGDTVVISSDRTGFGKEKISDHHDWPVGTEVKLVHYHPHDESWRVWRGEEYLWIKRKNLQTKKPWKIGDRFVTGADRTVYLIKENVGLGRIRVTWPGEDTGTTYLVNDVADYFERGVWRKVMEETNIQENVSPVQTDGVSLHQQQNQTTMTKTTTYMAPKELIIAGHKTACSAWKTKLEEMFPEAFDSLLKLKVGSRIAIDGEEFIIAQVDMATVAAICLEDGNRWTDPVVKEGSMSEPLTVDQAQKLFRIPGNNPDKFRYADGSPIFPSRGGKARQQFEVTEAFIREAHERTPDQDIKDRIEKEYPTLFGKYVRLVDRGGADTVTFGRHTTHVDGVEFIIGDGLAPRPELQNGCIGVYDKEVEVELIKQGGYTWIAFKKK